MFITIDRVNVPAVMFAKADETAFCTGTVVMTGIVAMGPTEKVAVAPLNTIATNRNNNVNIVAGKLAYNEV